MKTVTMKTSLVVIGGGISGVCAALAAASFGIQTTLVHNRPVLGGNSSSEIRVWMRGATGGGNLFSEEMGIIGMLKLRNLWENPEYNPLFWDEILLDAILEQKNIRLLLNTHIENTVCREGRIFQVEGVQQASEIRYILQGDYFIDATGDGMIGEQAGVPYRIGDLPYTAKNKEQIRELLSCSILYYVKDCGKPVKFVPPKYAYDMEFVEALVDKGGRIISEKQTGCDCWWFEFGGLSNTITDIQQIGIELKRLVLGIWNYIKNSGKYPGAENCTLEWIGSVPGKRESRRMMTEYELTREDILSQRQFEDGAFYGGWYMDFHPAGGLTSREDNCVQIPVNVYSIPLRCLFGRTVPNLIFAGRNIGTRREAFASTRIMNTCALSGQAAAALVQECLRGNCDPGALCKMQVERIVWNLLREDMFIPGRKNEDPADMARQASISASTEYQLKAEPDEDSMLLLEDSFLVFPKTGMEEIEILFTAEKETVLEMELFESSLPNRFCPGNRGLKQQILVPEGENWINIRAAGIQEGKFCTIRFKDNENLALRLNRIRNPGILCGRKDSSDYKDPCVVYKDPKLYGAEHINDGYARPYDGVHIWCSEAEKFPWIMLEWDTCIQFDEVRIYLDPELSMEIPSSCAGRWNEHHKFSVREGMPRQLAKQIYMEYYWEGNWLPFARVKENYQRMVVGKTETAVAAERLRITIEETWGDPRAWVYQVSVYKKERSVTDWNEVRVNSNNVPAPLYYRGNCAL